MTSKTAKHGTVYLSSAGHAKYRQRPDMCRQRPVVACSAINHRIGSGLVGIADGVLSSRG